MNYDLIREVTLQFSRLKRRHEESIVAYDEITLMDLAVAMRNWMDLKSSLVEANRKFLTKREFICSTPNKKLLNAFKDTSYFYTYLKTDVTTYGINSINVNRNDIVTVNKDIGSFTGHIRFSVDDAFGDPKGKLLFNVGGGIFFSSRTGENDLKQLIEKPRVNKLNFTQWLGSEFIRINIPVSEEKIRVILNREEFVRKMANHHTGASHPRTKGLQKEKKESFESIKYLYNFKISGYPIPYFLMLSISQDMVNNIGKILSTKS